MALAVHSMHDVVVVIKEHDNAIKKKTTTKIQSTRSLPRLERAKEGMLLRKGLERTVLYNRTRKNSVTFIK
jgi:hypothetical protein